VTVATERCGPIGRAAGSSIIAMDEIVAEQPVDSPFDVPTLVDLMCRPTAWAPDLILGAEGRGFRLLPKRVTMCIL
jgi:hypothetical protein